MFDRETLDRSEGQLTDFDCPIGYRGGFGQLKAPISIRTTNHCRQYNTCLGRLRNKLILPDFLIEQSPLQLALAKQHSTSCHMQCFFLIGASNAWTTVWCPVVVRMTIVNLCFGAFHFYIFHILLLGYLEQFYNSAKAKNNTIFLIFFFTFKTLTLLCCLLFDLYIPLDCK